MQPSTPSGARGPGDDGTGRLLLFVKRDCPTCQLVAPLLDTIAGSGRDLTVVTQDDPTFPSLPSAAEAPGRPPQRIHDADLLLSHRHGIEIVPTLVELHDDEEARRAIGWNREDWRRLTGIAELGTELPETRPGCGALNLESRHRDRLEAADRTFTSRFVEIGDDEDAFEAAFARGWTDGLPVVPPTAQRVHRMLGGTVRAADEVLGHLGPDGVDCTVEKVATNAVMAGCLPEFLPVVLAAVEAAADPAFNWHGLAATTYFSGPVMVVNGPIVRRLGLNTGINALGQGHRANLTIGRALNLTLRNVGGARPGEIDRATLGNPGKLSFCIAENEDESPWPGLARSRGVAEGESAVTLFAGEGPRGVVDQLSRTPESLALSLAWALRSVAHPKLVLAFDAILVVSPEHGRVFREAGWSREDLVEHLLDLLQLPTEELARGAGGCAEGLPPAAVEATPRLPKFRPDGLLVIHAGGRAGLFSAVIGGWVNGETGSQPVTKVVTG